MPGQLLELKRRQVREAGVGKTAVREYIARDTLIGITCRRRRSRATAAGGPSPAQRSWRRLDGHALLPKLILGVKFADGIEVVPKNAVLQPAVAAA